MLDKTVRDVLRDYLNDNGYDGLYSEGECACELSDLCPCEDYILECKPGYKTPCPESCGEGHNFHISKTKQEV